MTAFTYSLAIIIGIDAYASGIPRPATAVSEVSRMIGSGRSGWKAYSVSRSVSSSSRSAS
jgi:hypothetical protein